MCLYADPELSRPICPRTYYKVVAEKTRLPFFYPSSGIVYKQGSIVKGYKEPDEYIWSWFRDRKYVGNDWNCAIRGGAIHVLTDLRQAEELLHTANFQPHLVMLWIEGHRVLGESPKFELISVRCRPEHWLAYGIHNDAAYTEVEVLS